jgi:hypothetical protein
MRDLFFSTAAGSSSTLVETFRLSYGPFETPPRRVKNQILAPSGSAAGAT